MCESASNDRILGIFRLMAGRRGPTGNRLLKPTGTVAYWESTYMHSGRSYTIVKRSSLRLTGVRV